MAKPKQLHRGDIAHAALAIIDHEGLERLTVRRLAAELGISAPTLYHHYHDREDILRDVVRIVLAKKNVVTSSLPLNPIEAIVAAARNSYLAIAAHPNAMPLFRVEYSGTVFREWYEHLILLIEAAGIPTEEAIAALFTIESLVTGIAGDNASRVRAESSLLEDHLDDFPALGRALEVDSLEGVALVEKAVRSLLAGWGERELPTSESGQDTTRSETTRQHAGHRLVT